jgi:hypothetical protein
MALPFFFDWGVFGHKTEGPASYDVIQDETVVKGIRAVLATGSLADAAEDIIVSAKLSPSIRLLTPHTVLL